MNRTLKFKLELIEEAKESLKETMRQCNSVFNEIAFYGFENHTTSKIKIHNATYYNIRDHYTIPSALVQTVRDVACETLKSVKKNGGKCPIAKEYSSVRYDQRTLRVTIDNGTVMNLGKGTASISSVDGRIKSEFFIPYYYIKYINWVKKSSTLKYDKRIDTFYLHLVVESDTPELTMDGDEETIVGVDRGIVNIAVASDNEFFNSKIIKNTRAKYAHLRKVLQSKGTKSAKNHLKVLSGRERRFVTDMNHCISKKIAAKPYDVIAIEDLNNIRLNNRKGKNFNRKLNNWAFFQLEQFIKYKAEPYGKEVKLIDPKFTSQRCSCCGHTQKENRAGSSFHCLECGFNLNADLNAARNIAYIAKCGVSRLNVNQPIVASESLVTSSPSLGGSR